MLPYKEPPQPLLCPEAETETDCGRDSSIQPATVRIKLGINPFTSNVPLPLSSPKSRVSLPRPESLQRSMWCSQQDSLQTEGWTQLPLWEGSFSRLLLWMGRRPGTPKEHMARGGDPPRGAGPSPGLGEVEVTPETLEEALCNTARSLERKRARWVAGSTGWLLFTVLRRAIKRNTLL